MGHTHKFRSKGRKLPGDKVKRRRGKARRVRMTTPRAKAKRFTPPKDPGPRTYWERNQLLADLGFESYADYLRSPLWSYIRMMAFRVHGSRCTLCRKRAHSMHHVSYSRAVLLGEDLAGVVPICRVCHDRVELKRDGSKRTLQEVKRAFRRLLRKL